MSERYFSSVPREGSVFGGSPKFKERFESADISNLSIFVISSDQLGAKEKHVANAMQLMPRGPRVRHYWDGYNHVGIAVQRLVEGLPIPAWDFWMLYAPGTTWGEAAPEPNWWEHELGVLHKRYPERELNAVRFAARAEELAFQ